MKNIKTAVLICAVLILGISCQTKDEQDGFLIEGTVIGMDDVYIKLCETGDWRNSRVIDSTLIENGKFTFKGKLEHVDLFKLDIDSRVMGLVMLENSKIKVKFDLSDMDDNTWSVTPVVSGSNSHTQYTQIKDKASAVFKKEKYKAIKELKQQVIAAKKSQKKEDMDKVLARAKELEPLNMEMIDESKKIKFDFIDLNPTSPVAVHVMGFEFSEGKMGKENIKKYYDFFQGDARKTPFYKEYMTNIYKNLFEKAAVGNIAPDFTLNSVNGKEVTLSKVKGKYLLVDFWASWCLPCRASFPHLKKIREKYLKDGFEIVGIATGDTEDKWRKAIQKDQTPWINLFDESAKRGVLGTVAEKYGVAGLPSVFLIDSERKILLRNPSKDELEAKLKELIGE